MSLLSSLFGINLPGLGNSNASNPFSGLVGGGFPTPPTQVGSGFNSLIPSLVQAFEGKLGRVDPALAQSPVVGAKPFVSQDERSSMVDRTGLVPPAPTSQHLTTPPTGTTATPGKQYDDGSIPDSYYRSIRAAESGGNDNAKNPLSSATGRYQFTGSTWGSVAKAHPELGLTPDGRYDANQQERAIRAFTQDNARVLASRGIPISGGSLYASHFLGVGGAAKVYQQPDTARMEDVVGPGVVAANGFLRGMTVGDFKNWASKKGGGGGAAMGVNSPTSSGGFTAGPDTNTALANPGGGNGRKGGGGMPNGSPDAPRQGGTVHNSLSMDYKRYAVRKNIDHLRGLSPVAKLQSLENIGKGLSVNGGGSTS